MSKEKMQVLLRGQGWRITRANDAYGYRLEGDLAHTSACSFEGSLPLSQADVATLFASEGLTWRMEAK